MRQHAGYYKNLTFMHLIVMVRQMKNFIVKYTFYCMSLMGPLNLLVRFLCSGHDRDSQKPSRLVCLFQSQSIVRRGPDMWASMLLVSMCGLRFNCSQSPLFPRSGTVLQCHFILSRIQPRVQRELADPWSVAQMEVFLFLVTALLGS